MKKPVIGILGGIGAEASVLFYDRLIKKVQSLKLSSNSDYPHIIINSVNAPEMFVEGADLSSYDEGIMALERAGADFIVIACNTAHLRLDIFQSLVDIPIIDLKSEFHTYLKKKGVSDILVVGSQLTSKKLFDYKDVSVATMNKDDMLTLNKLILQYVRAEHKEQVAQNVKSLFDSYTHKNIVLACTELSTMAFEHDWGYLDTFSILLSSAFERWKNA